MNRDLRNSVFGIRHAQTKYTEDGYYNGNSIELIDAVLSKKGIEQCKKIKDEICKKIPNLRIILVSPFMRAI